MACQLSPSPSGRRLSELLEEQQEPFSLDLHLLEKGCSSARLLDGYDSALCWPAPATDAAAVLRRLTSKKKPMKQQQKQQPAGGILKLLLSKILHGKTAANRKKLQFSDSFKLANNLVAFAPAPPSAVKTAAGEVKVKEKQEEMTECSRSGSDSDSDSESAYSDEDEKQLSPVSVLEPHPFDSCSPIHGKLSSPVNGKLSPSDKNAAMDAFRDLLLDAAYSPALLTHLLATAKSDDLVVRDTADVADDEEDEYYYGGYRSSPKSNDDAAHWEAHRAELARVSELVAGEVPSARLGHADLLAEREDVGAGVAAAVLEALMRELVVDLGTC